MINGISKPHCDPIISFWVILLTNQLTNNASRLYSRIINNTRKQYSKNYLSISHIGSKTGLLQRMGN